MRRSVEERYEVQVLEWKRELDERLELCVCFRVEIAGQNLGEYSIVREWDERDKSSTSKSLDFRYIDSRSTTIYLIGIKGFQVILQR